MSDNIIHPLKTSELAKLDEELLFEGIILLFLLSKLTEDEKDVLRDIAIKDDDPFGYRKTQVPDFSKKRRFYEVAWGKLEAQGFIMIRSIGNMKLCKLTIRGKQAIEFLNEQSK